MTKMSNQRLHDCPFFLLLKKKKKKSDDRRFDIRTANQLNERDQRRSVRVTKRKFLSFLQGFSWLQEKARESILQKVLHDKIVDVLNIQKNEKFT